MEVTSLLEVKFHKGFSKKYEVSLENFKKVTHEKEPYKKDGQNGKEAYALCPLCDNAVKLLGVYKKLEKQRPHARHCTFDVDGIAEYDECRYFNCPNHRERADYVIEVRPREDMTDFNREILRLAHDYFDKCIYILGKTTGLVISAALAEKIALEYMAHPGYMTYDITRENVPYIMGLCMEGKRLENRVIRENSPIYEMLKNKKEIVLTPCSPVPNNESDVTNKTPVSDNVISTEKSGQEVVADKEQKNLPKLYKIERKESDTYLGLLFSIVNYRFVAGKTSKLREFMKLHIGIPDGEGTYKTYAEKEIEIDPFFFNKLIHSKKSFQPKKELANIADRILVFNEY